ncbi:hypothetical protein EUA66_02130 [TM7 phylum sp. oral taxon 349]|nr:hypothetical protein EUA66_02130 [TM7 phylum sp. oral taxon 349]
MKSTLLHIPHAATRLPSDFWQDVTLGWAEIEREALFICDYKVDELASQVDCAKVVAEYSRLYCDVERFRDDADEPMAQRGMGAVYRQLPGGKHYREITSARREEILARVYDPHHAKLDQISRQIADENGECILVDLHSYSDELVAKIFGKQKNLPDVCLGYDEVWFERAAILQIKNYIESLGYSCAINHPYAGALVPNWAYSSGDHRVRAVMLELNRRAYLLNDFVRRQAKHDFVEVIRFISTLDDALAQMLK